MNKGKVMVGTSTSKLPKNNDAKRYVLVTLMKLALIENVLETIYF